MAESEFDRKIGKVFETIFDTSKKSKSTEGNDTKRQTQIVVALVFGVIGFVALQVIGAVGLMIIPVGFLFYKYIERNGSEDIKNSQKDNGEEYDHGWMQKDDTPCPTKNDPLSTMIYRDPFDDDSKK